MNAKANPLPELEEQAITWALQHIDGPLDRAAQQAFADWLARNGDHAEVFEQVFATWDLFEVSRHEQVIIDLRAEALEALQVIGTPEAARFWHRWPIYRVAMGAAMVVALGTAILVGLIPRADHYQTVAGERRVVTLSDGSRVMLEAQTSLWVHLGRNARDLTLDRGRAMFTVAKDPLRPFTVESDGHLVVATGTEFSVERLANQTRVVLFEGHVAVVSRRADGSARPMVPEGGMVADHLLWPGRELVMDGATSRARVFDVPNMAAERAWQNGQLDFSEDPLGLAAERMNRYLPGRHIIVVPAVARLPVSGLFDAGDIDSFTQAMVAIEPVVASQDEAGNIVFNRR
ncbi:transmembrane sensor [Sphingomonas sp. BE270]|uniref:FecR family protein n=1 Tax=Sphingomonas sp. BE270 TaxID=2817726 RepID=UPI0028601338|nr:FecR domain-containing protein [Sphingomonas sp. BE270]MDR7259314.1 transmembrane sensor [Sphingomonas sp. BE270]